MSQQKNLNHLVNAINTEDDFVVFVQALAEDLNKNRLEWENDSLERYLEAIAAWSQNIDSYFKNTNQPLPENVNWRIIGQILLAAKVYEQ